MTVYYDPTDIYYDDTCLGPVSDKAWMSVIDADLLEEILLYKAEQVDTAINVLEWGSGRSTLYYSSLLANRHPGSKWVSLEHNQQSFNEFIAVNKAAFTAGVSVQHCGNETSDLQFSKACPSAANIFVFDYGMLKDPISAEILSGAVVPEKYIQLPKKLPLQYDVIIVDGRFRRRCLVEAVTLLREGGVVVLHDAWREYYHCVFENYHANFRLGEELWIGSLSPLDFVQKKP